MIFHNHILNERFFEMTIGGLFSGIGGFELAAIRAGLTPVWSNEIDPYCCSVLRKNFNHEIIEKDIRQVKGLPAVDIICGGFPCQPFSSAGLRQGTTDYRFLWPEMFRVVREVQPPWVICENVAGIISMGQQNGSTVLGDEELAEWMESSVLQKIAEDLEQIGYAVQPFVIPACAVGAPHRRDRIWIIADRISQRGRQEDARGLGMDGEVFQVGEREESAKRRSPHNRKSELPVADTSSQNDRGNFIESIDRSTQQSGICAFQDIATDSEGIQWNGGRVSRGRGDGPANGNIINPNPNSEGLPERESVGQNTFQERPTSIGTIWESHWLEVAARICRMDDGISGGMDQTGQVPAKSKNKTAAGRQHRIKALGNAIVPQVAELLFQAILKQPK